MPNLYYNPEHFNAEVIGSVDIGGSYEFNILLVIKDKTTGKLYFEVDAGCSCPTPFEDYRAITEFREVVSANEFAQFARQWVGGGYSYSSPTDRGYVERLITKVRSRMRNRKAV